MERATCGQREWRHRVKCSDQNGKAHRTMRTTPLHLGLAARCFASCSVFIKFAVNTYTHTHAVCFPFFQLLYVHYCARVRV